MTKDSKAYTPSLQELQKEFARISARKLNLDLTRGKPSEAQLALSESLLHDSSTHTDSGIDCRNYGLLEGLSEARELFGEYLGTPAANTFVLGNSSLTIMHDIIVQMLLRPLGSNVGTPSMICPVPGYDRHHAICQLYGINMLPVPLHEDGPDVEVVRPLLKSENVIGMWCTPKYSNPTGITYSAEMCKQLAQMEAPDSFRIFWDLAYNVHNLAEPGDTLPNMFKLCHEFGNDDRVFVVGSTSKITLAGAGLSAVAGSSRNMAWFRESLSVQTIGHDKLNQLRHVRFLKNMAGIRAHMAQHRAILKPKFDAVDEILSQKLDGRNIATWNKPRGGYFTNLYVPKGHARRVIELSAQAGVKLTPAGAAFPYGNDPDDSHIRLAPSFPPLQEVRDAMEVVALCIQIAAAE